MLRHHCNNQTVVFSTVLVITSILAFLTGYGFDRFSKKYANSLYYERRNIVTGKIFDKRNFESRDRTPGDDARESAEYHEEGLYHINATYIDEMLRFLTKEPHLGGSPENTELGNFMAKEWKTLGFDHVDIKEYSVLLSYPRKPANITLMDKAGQIMFQAKTVEDAYFGEENNTKSVYPFNAFSASGTVEGEYAYVNYGETRDYIWLNDHNVSVEGKIVIAKYGYTFRGEKARLAQEHGAVGLLLYGDPEDYVESEAKSYPDTWDLPSGAIPRGNIANVKGDPLTPLYAAKDGAYRLKKESIKHLAKIPVTPISYADAYVLLSLMDGIETPDPNWQGGMNFTYHVTSKTKRFIRMSVDTPLERRNIQNVIATITGQTEPDRLVIVGNHRDAWVFGAGDPSSGTACLMAVAKALGKMLANGWRPRRTIMLISWDAEEYGLFGSTEWVQEFHTLLATRTVAYINVDIAVSGNYSFRAKSTPHLIDKLFQVTKKVAEPDNEMGESPTNLFDSWKKKIPSKDASEPFYSYLGSGSDFTPFYSILGIPSLDIRYVYNQRYHSRLTNYPSYHTIYDNYNYYKKFIDPDFRYHALVSKVWLLYTTELADDLVLPFNLTRYAGHILSDAEVFDISFQEILKPQNISMAEVKKAAYELLITAKEFHTRLKELNENDCHAVRSFNDQMMYFERSFIVSDGVVNNPEMKHIVYSPARKTLFSRTTFPGITSLLYDIEINGVDAWDQVREQISLLASVLYDAKYTLQTFGEM